MTAIILASGFSRRFGTEKLLMNIKGKAILLHVIDLVQSIGFKEIILVFQNEEIGRLADGRNIKIIRNSHADEGISASIKCGIQVSEPTDAYMFFMGDQPFIKVQTVNRLIKTFYEEKISIIAPKYGGINGNPVIFAASWKGQLESLTGDIGGRTIIKNNRDKVFFVEMPDIKDGMDIDTSEDYAFHERGE